MRRHFLLTFIIVPITIALFSFLCYSKEAAQKETSPTKPDVKTGPAALPALPDLIIVGGALHLDRQPFIAFSPFAREEAIIVPIRFRIENRGNADAGRFRIAIMQQLTAPPGAETEAMVEGDGYIGGLRPTVRYPREGVGFYNLRWNVIFPKGMEGKK